MAGAIQIINTYNQSLTGGGTFDDFAVSSGDSLTFAADQNHVYENAGAGEARYHNVIVYRR